MAESLVLSANNLTKQFKGQEKATGISAMCFDLHQGEVICVVGPSGAGKTTLLRCLAGLEAIDSGSMIFSGERSKEITMVFQDFNLWPHLTILENIVLAPTTSHGTSRKEAEQYAVDLLKKFDLFEKRLSYPDALSGGQRQRVAIIRALATRPKLLLLDEITSALDPELVANVLQMIKVLAQDGQSMIIATHHLKFATEVASKILFLEDGALVQESTPHDFVYAQQNPRIKDFVQSIY